MGYNGAMSDSQHTDLLPAYLAVGEDALKREAVIARLKARLATMGDLSFNSDEFDGEVAEGAAIAAACNTMPFASPVRLVYVRNADKLKRADAEELVNYLKAPSATTVLACEAEKLAKNTRLYKALAAAGPKAVIDCAPPQELGSCPSASAPWPAPTASRLPRERPRLWWSSWARTPCTSTTS